MKERIILKIFSFYLLIYDGQHLVGWPSSSARMFLEVIFRSKEHPRVARERRDTSLVLVERTLHLCCCLVVVVVVVASVTVRLMHPSCDGLLVHP